MNQLSFMFPGFCFQLLSGCLLFQFVFMMSGLDSTCRSVVINTSDSVVCCSSPRRLLSTLCLFLFICLNTTLQSWSLFYYYLVRLYKRCNTLCWTCWSHTAPFWDSRVFLMSRFILILLLLLLEILISELRH